MAGNRALYDRAMEQTREAARQKNWEEALKQAVRALQEFPADADARSSREPAAALLHRGDDLVAEDQGKLRPGQLAVCDVQVGAAHAAGADFEQDLAGARFRQRTILETQRGPRRL